MENKTVQHIRWETFLSGDWAAVKFASITFAVSYLTNQEAQGYTMPSQPASQAFHIVSLVILPFNTFRRGRRWSGPQRSAAGPSTATRAHCVARSLRSDANKIASRVVLKMANHAPRPTSRNKYEVGAN